MLTTIAKEIRSNPYFLELFDKGCQMIEYNTFKMTKRPKFSDKEFVDTLRFCDILSFSEEAADRNCSFQLLTFLYDEYRNNVIYQTFLNTIISRFGNFPAIKYLNKENGYEIELPFDFEILKEIKETKQKVPGTVDFVFTNTQYELYTLLTSQNSFSFSGPTSMGKSFIIKSFIRRIIAKTPKDNIVILVPTRALINQYTLDLNVELKELLLEKKIKTISNSYITESNNKDEFTYIFILTPERLLSYLSQNPRKDIKYLFVDEAQKLGGKNADTRTITTYLAIQRTLREYSDLNLFFASPNITNPEVFLQLYKKDQQNVYTTLETPVSQNLFFIDLISGIAKHFTNFDTKTFLKFRAGKFEPLYTLYRFGIEKSNIVYCNSVKDTISKSVEFTKYFNEEQSEEIDRVIKIIKDVIHKDYYLIDCLKKGVGYHFGNLPPLVRQNVEKLFKESHIKYLFCTSTLLEGVNLPAKNVFIFKDMKGKSRLSKIDFWNLAGRAGRLNYELYGNIICIRENEKDWRMFDEFIDRKKIEIEPSIIKETSINANLNKIEDILKDEVLKSKSKVEEEMLRYIANIINIDTLDLPTKYKSPLLENIIFQNKEKIIDFAKENMKLNQVPIDILYYNQSIDIHSQNNALAKIKANLKNSELVVLPNEINYKNILRFLDILYEIYNWSILENKLKDKNRLKYYALLCNKWINGESLNRIITGSISYNMKFNKKIAIRSQNEFVYEDFRSSSKQHVNILINQIIDDIDNILRYKFEKYFNNYYSLLKSEFGEKNAGANWALFLEYGSKNHIVISLQNMGFTRHTSLYIFKNHKRCLKIENHKLISINKKTLLKRINRSEAEYDEIVSLI